MVGQLTKVIILSSIVLLHSSSHPCRADPSIEHSWDFEDILAPYQHPSFLQSGPAENHNLLPINYLPDAEVFPPWFRDTDSRDWFTPEAYNHLIDNTPPTQSRSSTPHQATQYSSADEEYFRAHTLNSLISPDETASHDLPESGSSHPNVPAADPESLSTATSHVNGNIEIPARPVAMKRTPKRSSKRKFMQLNAKSSKQLQEDSESELKNFGWISLLRSIPRLQFTDLTKPWNRLPEAQIQSSSILSELISSNQLSISEAKNRFVILCQEILLRHGNLLAILTSPPNPDKGLTPTKSNVEEGLISQEENNLLNWLKDLFYNTPTKEDSDYSSLRSTMTDYLKIDPESENSLQIKWKTVKRRAILVSLQQAITTQAAIKILEAYLKSTNPQKRNELFSEERLFLNVFKYLKSVDQHHNFNRVEKKIPIWALSGFFPWKESLDHDYKSKINNLLDLAEHYDQYDPQKYFVDYNKANKKMN
ncbi:hypothetical protein VP01_134g1 [Puccinia sorghi]|uniref:Uncharacterized protein n=1 Tax=Puccinia sorghi TaxID=27349 RepID=A0A0L6VM67_9BASI|nr:hypothetical protein VP01_134g1 [Puccinia sorghi]